MTLVGWRHQPRRFGVGLAVILLLSATLMAWNLARGGDFSFYEASARSMSESWRALVFGAFDPAATVTLDKLSGFAVPQALSIRLFGMSTASLVLPQVIEGLVTVWAVSLIGLRWLGPGAGLLAAAAAASTPIFVSMFSHPMEDGLLTMALTVALLWWQRAAVTGRAWPLLVAAVFVGIGFQAKMMQAWFILPALALGTVVLTGLPLRRRVGRAAVVTVVAAVASVAWMTVVQLIPASGRPYVDGSTDDNLFAMVFGYNGIDRLLPHAVPGAVGALGAVGAAGVPGVSGVLGAVGVPGASGVLGAVGVPGVAGVSGVWAGGGAGGSVGAVAGAGAQLAASAVTKVSGSSAGTSVAKLLDPFYVTQVGWLYPIALAAIVFGAIRWWPRRGRARDRGRGRRSVALVGGDGGDAVERATFVVVVVWLVTAAGVLSAAHVPHTAYVAAIGTQLALLAALGWTQVVRLLRGTGHGTASVAGLPPEPAPGLAPERGPHLASHPGGDRAARSTGGRTRLGRWVAAGVVVVQVAWAVGLAVVGQLPAVLAAPMVVVSALAAAVVVVAAVRPWVLGPGRVGRRAVAGAVAVAVLAGTALFSAQVLDATRDGSGGDAYVGVHPSSGENPTAAKAFQPSAPALVGGHSSVPPQVQKLVDAARAAGGGANGSALFVTDSWALAAEVIDDSGAEVLADGGYSGTVPVLTEAQVDSAIRSGVHLVAVKQSASPTDPVREAAAHGSCTPLGTWATGPATDPAPSEDSPTTFTLYRCD